MSATTIFVDSNKTGGGDTGADWTNAYLTYQQALDDANVLTKDIFIHAGTTNPHLEAFGAATITFTSTAADSEDSPIRTYTVDANNGDVFLPAGDAAHAGGVLTNTGFNVITFGFNHEMYGMHVETEWRVYATGGFSQWNFSIVDMTLTAGAPTNNNFAYSGPIRGTDRHYKAEWRGYNLRLRGKLTYLDDCVCDLNASGSTAIISLESGYYAGVIGNACDFSAQNNTSIVSFTTHFTVAEFNSCKMPATWTAISSGSSWGNFNVSVKFNNCDDAADYERTEWYYKGGSVKTDTGVYLTTGGWFDETSGNVNVPLSLAMVPLSALHLGGAYGSIPVSARYSGALGSKIFTVELIDDFEVALQDDEVWLDIYYHPAAGEVGQKIATSRVMTVDGAANLAAGTGLGNWTGEPAKATLPRSVKLAATANIQQVGRYSAVVRLGKYSANDANGDAGASLWVAPKLVIA